jgi:hypothetical protein
MENARKIHVEFPYVFHVEVVLKTIWIPYGTSINFPMEIPYVFQLDSSSHF